MTLWRILNCEVGAPYANLSPLEVVRIRFWEVIASFAERRWLEANGWRRVRSGWLLPDWHPHKRQADVERKGLRRFDNVSSEHREVRKEPYTQNHAANSQRAHEERRTVQRRNSARHKAPPFPPQRWAPYATTVNVASLFLTVVAMVQRAEGSIHGGFVLASGLLFCVSFFISHRARRAWELDWAESQLMRKPIHEPQIHHTN